MLFTGSICPDLEAMGLMRPLIILGVGPFTEPPGDDLIVSASDRL